LGSKGFQTKPKCKDGKDDGEGSGCNENDVSNSKEPRGCLILLSKVTELAKGEEDFRNEMEDEQDGANSRQAVRQYY
jgi:hypothetical protein